MLTERGHSFSLLRVDSFTAGMAYGADATLLQNYVLSDKEVEAMREVASHRVFISDCSDPNLINNKQYQDQLSLARMVTVPNEWLRKELAFFNSNIAIVPSCIDIPYFMQANRMKYLKTRPPVLTCIGPYKWELVHDALIEMKERYPKIIISADAQAKAILGEIATEVEVSVQTLPLVLHASTIGLCPIDGDHGWDSILEDEYGILCRPVIKRQSAQKETWVAAIEDLLTDPKKRAQIGQEAFAHANEQRATKLASRYLEIYRKRLPHFAFS